MPSHIGRYEILAELGRGGMAMVYHARDPRFKREVAIKVLPREVFGDAHFRARFEREAEIIAALEHPGIVPVYDFGEEEGQLYLVMRYMPGGSFAGRLREGPLSLDETLRVLGQIAPALDYAHSRKVIHRDLKPGNILLDPLGHAYLSDFGIAKLAESTTLLTGGGVIGTPAYMSPEQIHGDQEIDWRSDIYALGVIVFQMLGGQLPFQADTPPKLMMQHLLDPAPSILAVRPDLPPGVEDVLYRALAKDRNERFGSAEEMVRALERAAERDAAAPDATMLEQAFESRTAADYEPDSPAIAARPAPRARPSRRRGMPLWAWVGGGVIGLGVCGALIVGLGAWLGLLTLPGTPDPDRTAGSSNDEETDEPAETDEPTEPSVLEITPIGGPTTPSVVMVTPIGGPPGGGSGRIAFTSQFEGRTEIYVMEADGSNLYRLTGQAGMADWSPDGTRIAFTSLRDGNDEIYVMDADGSNVIRLTDDRARDWAPVWSPDGTRIAFTSDRDGDDEIYVMDADGSNVIRLTDHAADEYSPDWSPDGTRIAFTSNRDGNAEIYVMDADGSNVVQLTTDGAWDTTPAWSPDGTRIAFTSDRDGNLEIYVMEADGSNLTRLTNDPAFDNGAAWSPDGTRIAFQSDRHGNTEIYVMDADGSNVVRLTNDPAIDYDPVWQPIGGAAPQATPIPIGLPTLTPSPTGPSPIASPTPGGPTRTATP